MSSASLFPNRGVAMSVDHRKDLNQIACYSKDDDVRETPDGAEACSAIDDRELLSVRLNPPRGILDFVKEFHPQALSLPLIPGPCITQILFCGRSEENVSTQSGCLKSLKTSSAGIRLSGFESASAMRSSIRSRCACVRGGRPSLAMLSQIFATSSRRSLTGRFKISGGTSLKLTVVLRAGSITGLPQPTLLAGRV